MKKRNNVLLELMKSKETEWKMKRLNNLRKRCKDPMLFIIKNKISLTLLNCQSLLTKVEVQSNPWISSQMTKRILSRN